MIHLTVKELIALTNLKATAESMLDLKRIEGYTFTLDDLTALDKIVQGFADSKVKIKMRKSRKPKITA